MPSFSGLVMPTGTDLGGRRSLRDVVDELSRPIDAADSTVRALAADAFRAAVRVMNRKGLWPWEIMDEDIAITANTRLSTATSAIKKPLAMHYLSAAGGTRDQRLGYLPYDQFIEIYNQNVTGEAHTYTIPNLFETGQILWFPIPSAADNARFTFYRVTPAPRAEEEAVEIPDYALEVYMAFAWHELMKRLPEKQRSLSITDSLIERNAAFKEISAHLTSAGDRSREVWA